jgi:hypothetical protein
MSSGEMSLGKETNAFHLDTETHSSDKLANQPQLLRFVVTLERSSRLLVGNDTVHFSCDNFVEVIREVRRPEREEGNEVPQDPH